MANPLVVDVVKQARLYLGRDADEKWSDDAVLGYLNTGIQKLYQLHPTAFYVTAILTEPPAAVAMGDEIGMFTRYAEALAHYVAAQCLIEGADDEFNAKLAKTHMDLFVSLSA